jgi:hypothetical protein
MRRRDFLIGSAGALGTVAPVLSLAQVTPCPVPSLGVQGGATVTTACTPSNLALAQACAALSAGQSVDFTLGKQSAMGDADLAWQTAFYHDDAHGLIHLMGKPANDDTNWQHQYYTVSTGQWTVVGRGMWSNPGHIYGNMSIDWTTGDVYQVRGGADSSSGRDNYRRAARWLYSTKQWGYTSTDIYSGALESHANGAAWHPNLYGPGDGGLIWDTQQRTCFWRKSNGAVQDVSHGFFGEYIGVGEYWPAQDKAVIGGASGGQLALVSPNGGGTPIVTPVGVPPVETAGNSYETASNFGSLHVHPSNPGKLLILERKGSHRVFTSTDARNWTQTGTHPFTVDPVVICQLRGGLNAFWGVGCSGSTQISKLWKPA